MGGGPNQSTKIQESHYLLSEDFEGTGFENPGWTPVGTPNPDYTTTVLHGLQSLNCVGAQQIYRTFSFSNAFISTTKCVSSRCRAIRC